MNRYSLRKAPEPWIALPNNGGEVGDMADITCELNKLLGNYEVAMDELNELREILRALIGNPHINLGDEIYKVRDSEGEGWDGPHVKAWSNAVNAAKNILQANV